MRKPAMPALLVGTLVSGRQNAIAALIKVTKGWHLTLPAAALHSNALAAALGTLVDMGLNLG